MFRESVHIYRRHHLLEQSGPGGHVVPPSLGSQLKPGVRGDVVGRRAGDGTERHGAQHRHRVSKPRVRGVLQPEPSRRRIVRNTLPAQIGEAEPAGDRRGAMAPYFELKV